MDPFDGRKSKLYSDSGLQASHPNENGNELWAFFIWIREHNADFFREGYNENFEMVRRGVSLFNDPSRGLGYVQLWCFQLGESLKWENMSSTLKKIYMGPAEI